MTTAEIRRSVVTHLLGTPIEERSDVYVAAAFDTLMAMRPPRQNPLARHLAAPARDDQGTREGALRSRDHFLNHAWKGASIHGAL